MNKESRNFSTLEVATEQRMFQGDSRHGDRGVVFGLGKSVEVQPPENGKTDQAKVPLFCSATKKKAFPSQGGPAENSQLRGPVILKTSSMFIIRTSFFLVNCH